MGQVVKCLRRTAVIVRRDWDVLGLGNPGWRLLLALREAAAGDDALLLAATVVLRVETIYWCRAHGNQLSWVTDVVRSSIRRVGEPVYPTVPETTARWLGIAVMARGMR